MARNRTEVDYNLSSFTSPLIVSPMPDGRKWKLVKPFSYHVGSRHSRFLIKVPKDFVTDFASVPQFLWSWLPYWGKYGKAAILHDFIYQTHLAERSIADAIFYEAMLVGGTKRCKAKVIYFGVRLFGWLAWEKCQLRNMSK